MITVAVVEDDPRDLQTLLDYIRRASAEAGVEVDVLPFHSGEDFLDRYPAGCDVAFLDIDMPGLNGVATARAVRATDQRVAIVFVTNMYQFALEGYEVRALDFLVKPVRFQSFTAAFRRALDAVRTQRPTYVELDFDKDRRLVEVGSILYAETKGKKLVVHTRHGDEPCNGPLKELERRLGDAGFAYPHQSYLVNLRHVEHVGATEVVVAGVELPLSRYKRRDFVQALTAYVGKVL